MRTGERERERGGERCVHPEPPQRTLPGPPSLPSAALRGDPTPLPPSPSAGARSGPPRLLGPSSEQGPSSCCWGGGAVAGDPGCGWDRVAACQAIRLHVEEVLDALGADRALALVLLSHRLLLGPGEMHLLGGRLRLVAGRGAAGEGGGVFVVDELDLRRAEGDSGQEPGPDACPGRILAEPLTSSSGFSSPSPTCSSGTFRRRRVLAGFLRRMEPRDSSVMLWICVGQSQPREWGRRGLGRAEPSLQPRLPGRTRAQSCGAQFTTGPARAVLRPHLPLPLVLGEVHLLEDLGALLHHQRLLVGVGGDVALVLGGGTHKKPWGRASCTHCSWTGPACLRKPKVPTVLCVPLWGCVPVCLAVPPSQRAARIPSQHSPSPPPPPPQ